MAGSGVHLKLEGSSQGRDAVAGSTPDERPLLSALGCRLYRQGKGVRALGGNALDTPLDTPIPLYSLPIPYYPYWTEGSLPS